MNILPVTSIELENFRQIKDGRINFHPQVNVLFSGDKGGKSSLIQALKMTLTQINSWICHWENFQPSSMDFKDWGKPLGLKIRLAEGLVGSLKLSAPYAKIKRDFVAVREALTPSIQEAMDNPPGSVTTPLPLVMFYTGKTLPFKPGKMSSFPDPQRWDAVKDALSNTAQSETLAWFIMADYQQRKDKVDQRNWDYRLPDLEWVLGAMNRAGFRIKDFDIGMRTEPVRLRLESGTEMNLSDVPVTDLWLMSVVMDIARRMVQLNPSPDLTDPERGTNTRAVVLVDDIDYYLSDEKTVLTCLTQAFPNAQFIVTTSSTTIRDSVPDDQVVRWETVE